DIGTLYLLKFYTDVLGLPGTYGGIIFLISKFFTAFTDMGTGIMLDSRRKIGPKGKFRPFILYASFPVTLLAIANFVGTPFDVTGKTVMATILFMLYGLFFSIDRKSTRLNSSHVSISYAVFCLKKKMKDKLTYTLKRSHMLHVIDKSLKN